MPGEIALRALPAGWISACRTFLVSRCSAATIGVLILIFGQTREAQAHLVTTGLGPFYDGLTHFFMSPEDLVAVLALALLAGMSPPSVSRVVVLAMPAAWFAGGMLGLHASVLPLFPWLTIATFVGLGLLIVLNLQPAPAAAALIAVTLGLAHGFMNGSTMTTIAAPMTVLAGIVISLLSFAAIVAAVVISLHAPWSRIGVRVFGSWIAASGLLLLAWALRGIA